MYESFLLLQSFSLVVTQYLKQKNFNLPYTQNRKLGNLGNFSFTSNFDSSCNLRCKKKWSETKFKRLRYGLRRKN